MLICQHCGQETSERARVCPRCGSFLSPQFSTQYLQPPDSYRSRRFITEPPRRAYPTHQFFPPLYVETRSGFPHRQLIAVPSSAFGTASLILGIASIVSGIQGWMLPIVGVILGFVAIPLGAIGIARKEKYGTTGFVLGVIGVILGLLWIFYFSALFYGLS